MALQSACDSAIEIRRRELDRMGRDHPRVQAIEPARIPIAPRAIFGNGMIVDAIASGLGKGAIGDLVHTDCARRGAEYVERLGVKGPAPVSAHHRIAGSFDLRERREPLGGNYVRGIFLKKGSVLPPGLGRRLVERAADGKEQLRWLADNLVHPVEREPQDDGYA